MQKYCLPKVVPPPAAKPVEAYLVAQPLSSTRSGDFSRLTTVNSD